MNIKNCFIVLTGSIQLLKKRSTNYSLDYAIPNDNRIFALLDLVYYSRTLYSTGSVDLLDHTAGQKCSSTE